MDTFYYFQADILFQRCGVTVSVQINSETNRTLKYESHPKSMRSVEIQAGQSYVQRKIETRTVSNKIHTPKKRKLPPKVKCVNLPRSKKQKSPTQTTDKRVTGKCAVCSIIWKSTHDIDFRKSEGNRKTTWIGCDIPRCKYWAHALCANLLIIPGKAIKKHKFVCPEHRK